MHSLGSLKNTLLKGEMLYLYYKNTLFLCTILPDIRNNVDQKKEVEFGVDSYFFCFSYMIFICDLTLSKIQFPYL